MKKGILIFYAILLFGGLSSTIISFCFDNIQITGETERFLEFDVMAKAGEPDTHLGSTQVYLQYSNLAFGEDIHSNSCILVIKGSLLAGEIIPGVPLYGNVQLADNEINQLGIQVEYPYPSYPDYAVILPTEYTDLLHIKITIQDTTAISDISYVEDLMQVQQYESDNQTLYSPVYYNGVLNIYLCNPEQPIITSIICDPVSQLLTINWDPTSYTTSYSIFSCDSPDGTFLLDESGNFSGTSWTTSLILSGAKRFYIIKAYN